jgi:hypothetical protein
MILFFLALACKPKEEPVDTGDKPPDLEVPSVADLNLEEVYETALGLAATTDLRPVWAAHVETLTMGTPGCPDFYAGAPTTETDVVDEPSWSWMDHCGQSSTAYDGYISWVNSVSADSGDPNTPIGRTTEGERSMLGSGIVSQGDDVLFEFRGDAQDAFSLVESEGTTDYTYSSQIDATVTGSLPFDGSVTPNGYRTEMYVRYSGDTAQRAEIRGNLYLFEPTIADRFDSVSLDLELIGAGASPDDCTLEPRGWISVRDSDAFWYDVVFLPRTDDDVTDGDYPDDPYTKCDGCGRLYIRGLDQGVDVCPDFSFLWTGALTEPEPEGWATSLRDLLEGR